MVNSDEQERLVEAGGGVLWRREKAKLEIGLVHRPKYDDWSHPKGKLNKNDSDLRECAHREVVEETGYDVDLGEHVGRAEYALKSKNGAGKARRPATKRVEYWLAEARGGEFCANDEVDRLVWLKPKKARRALSYDFDREILDRALGLLRTQD